MESVDRGAVERVEQAGIIFIDEIDKISGARAVTAALTSAGKACSETSCPSSKGRRSTQARYGPHRPYILFIAAGAFHMSKPSDLIPELQGRFPIRVELQPLEKRRLRADSH